MINYCDIWAKIPNRCYYSNIIIVNILYCYPLSESNIPVSQQSMTFKLIHHNPYKFMELECTEWHKTN